jgi:coenzyme PQQ precursor peptide PqqA
MEERTVLEWETPELEEIETSAEVTAYSGHWE